MRQSKSIALRFASGFVCSVMIAGCGGGGDTPGHPSTAYKLAVIDGLVPSGNDDSDLGSYNDALSGLAAQCTQGESEISDEAVVATHELSDRGKTETTLEVLQGTLQGANDSGSGEDCSGLITAYVQQAS